MVEDVPVMEEEVLAVGRPAPVKQPCGGSARELPGLTPGP